MSLTQLFTLIIDIPGRDRIEASLEASRRTIKVIGCKKLKTEIEVRLQQEADLAKWSLPTASDHASLMIRELILRAQGEWQYPFAEAELCHCRSVETSTVDQAIVAGAHTCQRVSSQTNASTSCGTCRPDVQKIINYRLGKPA